MSHENITYLEIPSLLAFSEVQAKGGSALAILYYCNLGVSQPETLLKNAYFGLKVFYDFLNRTRIYLESDTVVKRLAWDKATAPEGIEIEGQTHWVQLLAPDYHPNEPDATFKAFLDENVNDVYELSDDEEEASELATGKKARKFTLDRRIRILDRSADEMKLRLERVPAGKMLVLRPNTYTIERQIKALQALQDAPSRSQAALLRLMEPIDTAVWPKVTPADVSSWLVLTDGNRAGTVEQRNFVSLALATPDFAVLEGPPGSGKTTAICELILQLVRQGKRVLLCASTHVAVDNVLERLMDERNQQRDSIIPVRIGDMGNVSERARPWQLKRFVKTERNRILSELEQTPHRSDSQSALYELVRHGDSAIQTMVLEAANLVCGTTIGILQHPDIRTKGRTEQQFDVLIIDEASKTTFQEFLVPALLAKRWIIVGDPKQLSPYVDDETLAVNIDACVDDEAVRHACIDVFLAAESDPRRRRVAAVAYTNPHVRDIYMAQATGLGVEIADLANANSPWRAGVVVGTPVEFERRLEELPLDIATARAVPDKIGRRASAWRAKDQTEQPSWASELAWRLARHYEQRFAAPSDSPSGSRKTAGQKLRVKIDNLLPNETNGKDKVWHEIDKVRRVALPSILEALRYGFERHSTASFGTALTDGLPADALVQRHVLLSTQHRMHPDIAAFSHARIYGGEALFTPEAMTKDRDWGYSHGPRAIWLDVRGVFDNQYNSNRDEAHAVMQELKKFDQWAERNRRSDGQPWEVAVLAFYLGQESCLRATLKQWTGQPDAMQHFKRGKGSRPHMTLELCTVDRFQGHEADLVIITIANTNPTSFLQSPNRLNVALTRARYQRIIIGDRRGMLRAKPSVLGELAEEKSWATNIGVRNA